MPLKRKDFTFSNGNKVTVSEASWDISMLRLEIEQQARADRARLNGSGDPDLLYFHEMIYSDLAAASDGSVPSLQDAFQLAPEDLDAWQLAVAEVNPNWYAAQSHEQEEIEIGERKITVLSLRPSVLMRRNQLETLAQKKSPSENIRQQVFRQAYYPRLAACSLGDIPTEEEARSEWSTEDLQIWYDAAKRQIPFWFISLEQAAEQNQQAAQTAKETKKKRRAKS